MNHPVILFDGICNLCNGSVLFIIKRDTKSAFRFASLQSAFGQQQLTNLGLSAGELYSIILLEGDKVFQKSSAALRIARRLGGLWPMLFGFAIVPRFIRDAIYDLVARNRYKWFGKKDACMIPTPELKSRFMV